MVANPSPKKLAIWGFSTAVSSWKSPETPTLRLRGRVRRVMDSRDILALAAAPSLKLAATGVVGLKRTVLLDQPPFMAPELNTLEEEALEKLRKAFNAREIGWVGLDLSSDRYGFARAHIRTDLATR